MCRKNQTDINEAIETFPELFELVGFPGDAFRLSHTASYIGGRDNNTIMLYAERQVEGGWSPLVKGTINEMRTNIGKWL